MHDKFNAYDVDVDIASSPMHTHDFGPRAECHHIIYIIVYVDPHSYNTRNAFELKTNPKSGINYLLLIVESSQCMSLSFDIIRCHVHLTTILVSSEKKKSTHQFLV